jgi:trehalose-phosphatase
MKALMQKETLEALQHRLHASTRLLFFIDFDSILASASKGSPAPLPAQERELLRDLSEKNSLTLVLVSNHSVSSLKKLAGFSGIYFIGNNGLEIFGPDLNVVHAETKRARKDLGPVVAKLSARLSELPGVQLDNRDFSLSLNFSTAKSAVQRRARLLMEEVWTPVMDTFTLRETHNELEMFPRLGWGKNRAMMFIWNKFSSPRRRPFVIYISASENDEEIYNLMGREGMGVVVGSAARIQNSNAGYSLKNQGEVKKFIIWLSQNLHRLQTHSLSS